MLQGLPTGAVLESMERRGAVIERLDGEPAASWQTCAARCSTDTRCQAWTWRSGTPPAPPRCELLSAPRTPTPYPGAVTGLSMGLASRIETAGERAPSAAETRALRALDTDRARH